jgi:hypothetical protein
MLYFVVLVKKDINVNEHEILHYTSTQIKVQEQLVVRKDMDISKPERLSNITLRHQLKEEDQLVLRKDMDVNEHDKPSRITLRHKLK